MPLSYPIERTELAAGAPAHYVGVDHRPLTLFADPQLCPVQRTAQQAKSRMPIPTCRSG